MLSVVSQARVSGGNQTYDSHANSLAHYPLDYQDTHRKKWYVHYVKSSDIETAFVVCICCWQKNFIYFRQSRTCKGLLLWNFITILLVSLVFPLFCSLFRKFLYTLKQQMNNSDKTEYLFLMYDLQRGTLYE